MVNNFKMSDKTERDRKKYNHILIVQFSFFLILFVTVFVFLKSDSTKISAVARELSQVSECESETGNNDNLINNYQINTASVQATVIDKNNIDKSARGGVDIDISGEEIEDGIFFEKYELPFDIICPVDDYFVSSDFGKRENPISGGESIHTGIDLAAGNGDEIHSAYDGTVRKADYSQGYGNYIVVTHTDGVETLYAHCSSIKAKAGDKVKTGDTIAYVGSTGNSTGPHLHFEIRFRGVKLNPAYALGL